MRGASKEWLDLIRELSNLPQESVYPRGIPCRELLCHRTVVDMRRPVTHNFQRKLGHRFMAAEAWWILTGQNSVSSIAPYADIAKFSDDGMHFDGAYGPRVVDQVKYVVDTLVEDMNSRQAVMTIWRPNPRPSKDIPCTVSLQWIVRENVIHCIATMRSSDAWLGWPYDVFNFSCLTTYIVLLIRERPYICLQKQPGYANTPHLHLGNLYLTAGSQHLYETDLEAARDVCKKLVVPHSPILRPKKFTSVDHFLGKLEMLKDTDRGVLNI